MDDTTDHLAPTASTRAPLRGAPPPVRSSGRWARWIPLAVPVAFVVGVGWAHRWMTDDGFIYLRIVDQLLAGHGPVFNRGQRVEAYTSPAWTALLAAGDLLLPLRLEWIAVLLGLASAAGGVLLAMVGALRLAGAHDGDDDDRVYLPAGALVMVAPFGMWIWFTSGLETGLTWLWLGACLLLLARWADGAGPPGIGACVVLGLGWLVRPELVLVSTLFVVVLVAGDWRRTTWRQRARTLGAMVALPVAYQLFRMGYFGMVTANTAVAKEGSSLVWRRGVDYLGDAFGTYRLWLAVAVVVVAGYVPLLAQAPDRRRLVAGSYLLGAIVLTGYVVAIGGDYLHARMFVPSLFLLCAPLAALPVRRRYAGMALVVPWAVVAVGTARPATGMEGETFAPSRFGRITIDQQPGTGAGLAPIGRRALSIEVNPFQPDQATAADFEPSPELATPALLSSGIGAIGYALGPEVTIVDALGLADPIGSHFEALPDRAGKVGHEKPAPAAWVVAAIAAPGEEVAPGQLGTVTSTFGVPLIPLRRGEAFQRQVDAAREARTCEPIADLDAAATAPMGPGRFLENLAGAPARTRLRIPPNPDEAVAELCG